MKVAKFGGSSLASAAQIRKVAAIIQQNPDMKAVVVSAPGKRDADDTKVTDLLIALYAQVVAEGDIDSAKQAVLARYHAIISELDGDLALVAHFDSVLSHYIRTISEKERLLDALKACGEDFNAQVISQYLTQIGLDAHYISPKKAGIRVTDEPGNARLLDSSYEDIALLVHHPGILIIPGFFGYSMSGDIVTFSRGGSDISGAIIANGLNADIYENYTDESFIYAMHPGKVANAPAIKEITYNEMRELSYAGFAIFHDEALEPVYRKNIPVMIRNTNQPEIAGTKIVAHRALDSHYPVTGVSSDTGFLSISVGKYLLNREVGFTRRILQIFEDLGISIEHIPSSIDSISLILRKHQIDSPELLEIILQTIQDQLEPDSIQVEDDLAIFAIVGEAMRENVGIAALATRTFAQNEINIRMITQGASEISMLFAIPAKDEDKALNGLYQAYFNK